MIPKKDASAVLKARVDGIVARGGGSGPEIIDIFRLCRRVMERQQSKSKFPVLALYCDWLLHTELDRNESAFAVLEKVGLSLKKYADDDPAKFCRAVGHGLGLTELRQDILRMMDECGAPKDLFNSFQRWALVLAAIFEQLTENAITFPEKPRSSVQKIMDRMKLYSIGPNAFPHSLYITDRSNEPSASGRPAGFYWHIRLTPQSEIENYAELNGSLQMTETIADFLAP